MSSSPPRFARASLLQGVVVLGVLLLVVAWAGATLQFPFGIDNGIHAYQGWVLRAGGRPYVDVFDSRGPFVMYGYGLAQALFGQNTWGVRLLDLAVLALGVVPLARAVAALEGRIAGVFCGVLAALWWASSSPGSLAQPDGWAGMLFAGALAPLLRRRTAGDPPMRRWLALAGGVIGLCTFSKPFYAALIVPVLVAIGSDRARDHKARLSDLMAVALAGLGVGVAVLGVMWLAGVLRAFVEAYLVFNVKVYAGEAQAGWGPRVGSLLRYVGSDPTIGYGIVLAGAGAWIGSRDPHADVRRATHVGIAWTLCTIGFVLLQGRFWRQHWLPTIPPLALLTTLGVSGLRRRLAVGERARAGAGGIAALLPLVLALALLVVAARTPAIYTLRGARALRDGATREALWDYHTGYRQGSASSFRAEHEAARYIAARTSAQDGVLVWGYAASVPYLAQRRIPGRFIYPYPLLAGAGTSLQPRFRAEFLHALGQRPPCYVVFDVGDPVVRAVAVPQFPTFDAWLRANYREEVRIERFALLRAATAGCHVLQHPAS
ncbi:hypothetical protein rosag_36770 [Roseisolibacter agri]|uniref:Glycosyltransferase RgtA/B/C/D-like domain-containing protein n=2 Tax=Roseisolibacter agri TaxID=2014610 RepID=A0AA37VFN5_9BACT|nr:hypothetical protein rosag_36770 [Roseisolibacter agri]